MSKKINNHLPIIDWNLLSEAAWIVRENASILGKTKVGAALLTDNNKIYTGCNVEQRYRNHDVHAEVNAITTMLSNGDKKILAILVVAERERFTPCGSCLDWIFQFGGEECLVAYQSSPSDSIIKDENLFFAHELMPYYPK